MWAVLTILTAATVLTGMLLFHSPWINLVWFAIPAIGDYFIAQVIPLSINDL